MKNRNIFRHGELLLVQTDKIIGTERSEKDYIVAHSETGHHHMLLGMTQVFSEKGKDIMLRIQKETELKHKKDFDFHKTLNIPAGLYKIVKKTEYDPFLKIIREIWD